MYPVDDCRRYPILQQMVSGQSRRKRKVSCADLLRIQEITA